MKRDTLETILNAAYNVLSQIIFCRLSERAMDFVVTYQAGFIEDRRPGGSANLCGTSNPLKIARVPDPDPPQAAYDSLNREELWKIMYEHCFPGKRIRLVKSTMDE